ncbi:hypothetical protein [Sorangium sp. So ce388]
MTFWDFYAAHPVLGTIALLLGVAAFGSLRISIPGRCGCSCKAEKAEGS